MVRATNSNSINRFQRKFAAGTSGRYKGKGGRCFERAPLSISRVCRFFVELRKLVWMLAIKLGIFLAFLHDIGEIRNIYTTLRLNSQKQHSHYDTQNATLRYNDSQGWNSKQALILNHYCQLTPKDLQ